MVLPFILPQDEDQDKNKKLLLIARMNSHWILVVHYGRAVWMRPHVYRPFVYFSILRAHANSRSAHLSGKR